MIALMVSVAVAVIAAGLFSGMESAFLACPRLKVRHMARQGMPCARLMEQALRRPEPYLSALLVGTNLAVVGGTVAATRLLERAVHGRGEVLATILLTPVFLVASEILPKSYFLAHSRTICVQLARPLAVVRALFGPIAAVVGAPARLLVRSASYSTVPASREELVLLARPGVSSVRVSPTIGRVLRQRVAAAHGVAAAVMVPKEQVIALPADLSCTEALPLVRDARLTHFPVEREGRWIGFIHILDLAECGARARLADLALPLPEVHRDAGLEEILDTMRESAEHVAAVVHEGRQLGLVTLNGVMRHLTMGLEELPT